jgi:predicted metal-dependent hydrolase
MVDQQYEIRDKQGKRTSVMLRRDKRLTKTVRWERMPDGSLLLRVPQRLPKRNIHGLLEQLSSQLDKHQKMYSGRNDEVLSQRAKMINKKYFNGELQWNAIRWVSNMNTRLGSCTHGGPTDGQIRISKKIKDWPTWVVDYVVAHELLHRKYPHHSTTFWNTLKSAYPLSERAVGFIQGMNYATGKPIQDDGVDDTPDSAEDDMHYNDQSGGM